MLEISICEKCRRNDSEVKTCVNCYETLCEKCTFDHQDKCESDGTMMLNRVLLKGKVEEDPETRYTTSGTAVTTFTLITISIHKNKEGEDYKRTEWHKIVTIGPIAEKCRDYVKKGYSIFIQGSIKTRSWTGRDKQKQYIKEIIGQEMQILEAKP